MRWIRNKDAENISHRRWERNNPDKVKSYRQKTYQKYRHNYIKQGVKRNIERRKKSPSFWFFKYRSGAKTRGFDFQLSLEDFERLWNKNCFYCNDIIPTIGLDRVDSKVGYLPTNIVPCCRICNTMKMALPKDIFLAHCKKIVYNASDDE